MTLKQQHEEATEKVEVIINRHCDWEERLENKFGTLLFTGDEFGFTRMDELNDFIRIEKQKSFEAGKLAGKKCSRYIQMSVYCRGRRS